MYLLKTFIGLFFALVVVCLLKNKSDKELDGTRIFWDKVGEANQYKSAPITSHKSDDEMDAVLGVIKENNFEGYVCVGCADGCRDPLQMLQYSLDNNIPLPRHIRLNDISRNLLDLAGRKMIQNYSNIDTMYFPVPINQIESIKLPKDYRMYVILGVYSADYIDPSLNNYKEHMKDIIGTEFEISATTFDNKIVKSGSVTFNIDNYKDKMVDIYALRKSNFLAYSIITETGFISHYFDKDMFKKLCSFVFPGKSVEVHEGGSRYIVTHIKDPQWKSYNWLLTSLNNVVGNIPYDLQIKSLQKINSWIK